MAPTGILLLLLLAEPGSGGETPPERTALEEYRQGNHARAYRAYRRLAEKTADRADLYRAAAACARNAGMLGEAIAARRDALKIAPADRWSRLALARLLLAAGLPAEALGLLDDPATAWEFLARGQVLRRLGRSDDALSDFRRAREIDPLNPLGEQERAEVLERLDRKDDAAKAYRAALQLDPSFTHLQLRLAALESAIGLSGTAYERYRKALLVDGANAAAKKAKEDLAAANPELARAENAREKEKEREWEESYSPCLPPLVPSPLSPIAVGVAGNLGDFRLKCASGCIAVAPGLPAVPIPAQTEIRGEVEGEGLRLSWAGSSSPFPGSVRLVPDDPAATFAVFRVHYGKGFYWSDRENRYFRGAMEARRHGSAVTLINHVQMEDYLLSVVPSEMPAEWSLEALKAQAVAARTETVRKMKRHHREGYNLCATQHCAVYRGGSNEHESTSRAVNETRGKILKAGGEPLDAVFAANCGGRTNDAGEIWGSGTTILPGACDIAPGEIPEWGETPRNPDDRDRFLFSRVAAYCRLEPAQLRPKTNAACYRWVRSYTRDEIGAWLARRHPVGPLSHLHIGSTTAAGWITSITLAGSAGRQEVRADSIRTALNYLRSNLFTFDAFPETAHTDAQFLFVGGGWGHGAGMCQDGAHGMALAGKTYREILAHYYPKATLVEMY